MPPFIHLHVHTAYSLLDGAIRHDALMKRAVEYGMDTVTITDHGNMYGAIKFYQEAKKAKLKPIIGCEVYVAPGSRHDKEGRPGVVNAHHLVLLAENLAGYYNLVKLVSAGYLEGFYYKPRIDLDILKEHHEGLIALSACLQGQVAYNLMHDQYDLALEAARNFAQIMGPENFFIELQDAGLDEQKKVNPGLIDIAGRVGLGMVATNDCHYLSRDDHEAHEALVCIQTGKTLADERRMKMSPEIYFKSPDEMADLFGHVEGALANTVEIGERCEFKMPLGHHTFPKLPADRCDDSVAMLQKEAREGLARRIAELAKQGIEIDRDFYQKRLEYELGVLIQMGFPDYFLVVADFINWAKNQGIPVGPGRGSAAGSLVAYSMRITDLDPIRYALIFERFLNVERESMPDIDVDFCVERRDEVIKYVAETYGNDRVAQITTFGRMKAKAVVRDVGRVMEIPYADVDKIAKLIPNSMDKKFNLSVALEEEPRLGDLIKENEALEAMWKIASNLEGLQRHASTHAAGVVIGDRPLDQLVPVYRGPKDEIITQYDMKDVEKAGLIKFDFLGLRNLTLINNAVNMIRETADPKFKIETIPLDDKATYELLSSGDTSGVFQLESTGMKELLARMKPEVFEDIIALVALYRPGPLESGMVTDFVDRKHGRQKIEYSLPQLEPILKETYGVIVYQEQVQEIAVRLAGYSLGEGDILRRAMGKKVKEVMDEQKDRFMSGAEANQIPKDKAGAIFDLMALFAGYGFNKSHSAAYALVTFQTAYLKSHFPYQFMAALLSSESGDSDKVMKHIAESREHGLTVLPPDVNHSGRGFTVDGEAIRFGLAAVKNVGEGAVDAIIACRVEDGPYKDLFDLCERVDLRKVNRRVLESLIKCGAFDSTGAHRSQLMAVLDEALDVGARLGRDREGGQTNMFMAFTESAKEEAKHTLPNVAPWDEREELAFEKEVLGFYITSHPLMRYEEDIKRLASHTSTSLNQNARDGAKVRLAGLPVEVKEKITKKGDRMAFVRLEDLQGSVEVIFFPDSYAKAHELLHSEEPVLVKGIADVSEKGAKVKATEVMALEGAAQKAAQRLKLRLVCDNVGRDKMVRLKQAFERRPGQCRVYLHLAVPKEGEAVLAVSDQYKVNPCPELFDEVREIISNCDLEPVFTGD